MAFVQTAFLAGLAALAVPVLIHLLFRRRAKQVDLGTLRFLKVVAGRNTRRRRLKRYVLLTLRLAAVALLAGLFARPYLLASSTGGADSLLVVLVDSSASMSLGGGDARPIERAVERLADLASASPSRRVEIATFDDDARAIEPAHAASLAGETSFAATDYGRAIAWAADRCAASDAVRREVVILTDLQRSGLDTKPGLDTKEEPVLPADVPVRVVDLGRPVANNLAVTAAVPRRTSVRPGEKASLFVTIFNAGPFAAKQASLAVRLSSEESRRTLRKPVDVPSGETASVEFELPELPAGLWKGSVTIETKDDLAFDDARHFAVLAAAKDKILLVGPDGTSPLGSETFFLESALSLAPPGGEAPEAIYEVTRPATPGLPADLSPYRIALLANPGTFAAGDARRLREFVESGGGLLVFTGENVTPDAAAALEAAGLAPGRVTGVVRADDRPTRVSGWETGHPIFAPFADDRSGDLRALAFDAYTKITPSKDARVLARFGDDPALLETRVGRGRVLWFASSAGRDWGNWTRGGLFLPLVYQMLGRLTGLADGGPVRAASLSGEAAEEPGVHERNDHVLVVNVDPRESDLDRCTAEEFASRFGLTLAGSAAAVAAADRTETGRDLRRDELWPWLLIGMMGVLLAEGMLGNRTEA